MREAAIDKDLARLERLVGRQVDAYMDGKTASSRLVRVVIDAVGRRRDLTAHEWRLWRNAIRGDLDTAFGGYMAYRSGNSETQQFWDWNCDLFMSGHILNDERTVRDRMLFAMRPAGFGWHGVNWNYMLDVTGGVRRRRMRDWKTIADEQGLVMRWNRDAGKYHYFDKKTGRKVDE